MIYDSKEKRNEAIADLKQAYNLNKDFTICNYIIASDYDALGKFNDAYKYYSAYANSNVEDDEYKQYAKARAEELKNMQHQQTNNRVENLIKSKVSLAPMAGITDYVLRSLVRKYSPECLLTTEMISSEFLAQNVETEITKLDENHHPIVYQICGHKPHLMKAAATYLTQFADMIDINMGCPVNKVVKGQDGSALMRNPRLAMELVQAVKEGTNKPVSVKFRLGYTASEMNYVEFGQQMQEAGAEFITIHARTRSQFYTGHADWAKIKELKHNVDIPVLQMEM